MPTTISFPDGSSQVSTALTIAQINTLIQPLAAQMIGLIPPTSPLITTGTLTSGSNQVTDVSQGGAYVGCSISGNGIPAGAAITGVNGTTITTNVAATADGPAALTITDLNAWDKVRPAWQRLGQPGYTTGQDLLSIECTEIFQDYNTIRNVVSKKNDGVSAISTYKYTRTWSVKFTTYGPNGFDNLRAIKSALFLPWARAVLATGNLYPQPNFERTLRVPEQFQGQWQERSEWRVLLNEAIAETITVPTGASVEIKTYVGQNGSSELISDITVSPQE
jgi:hypothetical protein